LKGHELLARFGVELISKLSTALFGDTRSIYSYEIDKFYPVRELVGCRNTWAHAVKLHEYDIKRLEENILTAEKACRAIAAKLKRKTIDGDLEECAKSMTYIELDKIYETQISSRVYLRSFNMETGPLLGVHVAKHKRTLVLSEILTKWAAGDAKRLILQLVIPPVDPARLLETRKDLEYLRSVRWDKVLDLSSSPVRQGTTHGWTQRPPSGVADVVELRDGQ
jgi:hypothetical protein